jgi:hypothetical protein
MLSASAHLHALLKTRQMHNSSMMTDILRYFNPVDYTTRLSADKGSSKLK